MKEKRKRKIKQILWRVERCSENHLRCLADLVECVVFIMKKKGRSTGVRS